MSVARFFNERKLRHLLDTPFEPAWLSRHPRRSYIVAAIRSTPPWLPKWKLQLLHCWKRIQSERTGEEHVLDHEVPLCHPCVSGLTVPWNLRVVPRRVNATKGNRFSPDQLQLI